MKRPSEKTLRMLTDFYSSQSFWNSVVGRTSPIDFLDDIAASDEQLAIPHLAPMLSHKAYAVRDASARCIWKLYQQLSPVELPQFEEACRNNWAHDTTTLESWRTLKPSHISSLLSLPHPETLLGLVSFHNSGYVREAAVELLSKFRIGAEIPFLLLRLNDWVPEIRRLSAALITDRLTSDQAVFFVRNLRLVLRLRSCGRGEHESLVSRILSMLKSPESIAALSEGVLSPDRWMRRESFRLTIDGSRANSAQLLNTALADADPVLRLWAVKELLAKADPEQLRLHAGRLSRDKFRPVRCEALNMLASSFAEEAKPLLLQALFDSHGSVRALAQFWIQKIDPGTDIAQVYRAALDRADGNAVRASILGLGETGESCDAQRFLPYLENGRSSLRIAAIRSTAALNREAYVDTFIRALNDELHGVSSEAAKALKPLSRLIHGEMLSTFRSSPLPHVRRNAFNLLLTLPFWKRGIFFFEAIRDSDERILEFGIEALRNWILRTGGIAIPPTKDELEELHAALKASSGMLTMEQVQLLQFSLRTLE